MLNNLQKNTNINPLVPYILNYINKDYYLENNNGVQKKLIILKVIESLLYNQSINLEFHLHIIIQSLIHFIINSKLALNYSFQWVELRKMAGVCLSMIIFRYNEKYIELQDNICNLLYQMLTDILLINPKAKNFEVKKDYKFNHNYQSVYGIFNFFKTLQIKVLKQFILPILPSILYNEQFQMDLNNYHSQTISKDMQAS